MGIIVSYIMWTLPPERWRHQAKTCGDVLDPSAAKGMYFREAQR